MYQVYPVPESWPNEGVPVLINGQLIEVIEIYDHCLEPEILFYTTNGVSEKDIEKWIARAEKYNK